MRVTQEDILQYLKEIKSEFQDKGIAHLALFGSFAKREQTVYSDIDIAIQKEKDFLNSYSSYTYFDLISQIKDKIGKKFHKNIDVFDLDSQGSFKSTIEKELIYV